MSIEKPPDHQMHPSKMCTQSCHLIPSLKTSRPDLPWTVIWNYQLLSQLCNQALQLLVALRQGNKESTRWMRSATAMATCFKVSLCLFESLNTTSQTWLFLLAWHYIRIANNKKNIASRSTVHYWSSIALVHDIRMWHFYRSDVQVLLYMPLYMFIAQYKDSIPVPSIATKLWDKELPST